jgi:hypothetical protein
MINFALKGTVTLVGMVGTSGTFQISLIFRCFFHCLIIFITSGALEENDGVETRCVI